MTVARTLVRTCVPREVRNWLRSPVKSAHWILDQVSAYAGSKRVIEMRSGWKLVCHPSAYRCAYIVQDTDPAQKAEFDGFVEHCRPGMVLFDIGAHFGIFSLAALHYGGPLARAVAVDPSPVSIRMINHQAELNEVSDRLTTITAFVGDEPGECALVDTGVQGAGYFMPPKNHPSRELTRTRAVTLDELVNELGFAPTHLKIDVEGYEAAVLRGAQKLLSEASAPLLFLEIHNKEVLGQQRDVREALDYAKGFGYTIFDVKGQPLVESKIFEHDVFRVLGVKQ